MISRRAKSNLLLLSTILLLPLSAFLIFPISAANATPILTENFVNNSFNSSVWKTFHQGAGPSVTLANDSLIVTIPANSANDPTIGGFGGGIGSLCFLSGDFDFQVGFHLLVWPLLSGVRVGLGPSVGGRGSEGTPFAAERDSLSVFDTIHGEYYLTDMLDRGGNGQIPTTDLVGFLRIARTGASATGYYLNGTSWVPIHTGPVVGGNVGFGFSSWSHDNLFSHQMAKVAFSNFTLSTGQLLCPTLSIAPKSGPVGTLVTVIGTGFPVAQGYLSTAQTIAVTFDDMSIGSATNSGGTFSFKFDVPLAQLGAHEVKATDYATQTNASTTFLVTATPTAGLSVSLTVGQIYFPGDSVVARILVTFEGVPLSSSGLQLRLNLTKPDNSNIGLTTTMIGPGIFRASYPLSKAAQIGTYDLLVVASAPSGNGSGLASFEVKLPWLSSQNSTIAIAGIASVAALGVGLVAWRNGYFRRPSKDAA